MSTPTPSEAADGLAFLAEGDRSILSPLAQRHMRVLLAHARDGDDLIARIERARMKVPYSSEPLPHEFWRGYTKAIDELLGALAPVAPAPSREDHDPEACPLCGPHPALREKVGADVIEPHDAAVGQERR